jgi:hypothetical protein
VVFQQPDDPVVGAAFLVGRERNDDVAIRSKALLAQANEIGDVDCRFVLVVRRPAAVVIAVLFNERERVEIPVRRIGFDDVDMGEEQQRLAAGVAAAKARDEISLFSFGPSTRTSSSGKPAAIRRAAMASAARVVFPVL